MERFRTPIIGAAVVAGVVLIAVFVFASASTPAYACSTQFAPDPTPTPGSLASAQPGYVQDDMGNRHVGLGDQATYTYCPPASGSHYARAGSGPITPRLYGPSDAAIPQGWIHNLEHGALVILYRGDGAGATDVGQQQLLDFFTSFPPDAICGFPAGTVGPLIARFDEMATPFAALVWGRVLPLETFDAAAITAYWDAWGQKTNPECVRPTAAPSATPNPSASVAPSPSAS